MMAQTEFTFKSEVLSVSEITDEIKRVLERRFENLMVEGEISNVKRARSGHTYFTIKDDNAQMPCVMWRSVARSQQIELLDGQHIIVAGNLEVYPPHGKYQLIVNNVKQAGLGALQQAYEKLKRRLKKEGLFESEHKKELPRFPKTIGVITSATGAAFHDIQSTLEKRYPLARILLHHASVQGVNAAPELVAAIEHCTARKDIDVLIIGRGGGSLEDLWPFNEEAVARAIFNCTIPIISAVGHEIDYSISDFVADARAATPTHAAVLATPDINELRFYVDDVTRNMDGIIQDRIQNLKERVAVLEKSYAFGKFDERLHRLHESVERKREQLNYYINQIMHTKQSAFVELKHRLEKTNPNLPLNAGYSRIYQNEKWIKKRKQFDTSIPVVIEWEDGKVTVANKN